jgi:hypothetical protein
MLNRAAAQYIVVKVTGNVTYGAKAIAPGTELKNTDLIHWSSGKDKLLVIMIGKGDLILTKSPKARSDGSGFSELAIAALHLSSTSGALSGRGDLSEKIPGALQPTPKSNGVVIFEQENKFLFDPGEYPQGSGATFFVQIEIPDQQPFTRRLKTNNDTLLINYPDIKNDKMDSTVVYKMYYRDATKKSSLVTFFSPYFDLTRETEGMIAASVSAYQRENLSKEAVRDSVYSIVYSTSGKPNGISFTKLFDKYWLSKGK